MRPQSKIKLFLILSFFSYCPLAATFGNVYIEDQKWQLGPNKLVNSNISKSRNKTLLGIDYGLVNESINLYSFFEYENLNGRKIEQNFSFFAKSHFNFTTLKPSFYAQVYHHDSEYIRETNTIIGVGLNQFYNNSFWYRPFVGLHWLNLQDSFSKNRQIDGINGFMAGWELGLFTNVFGKKLTIIHWNEIEFLRNSKYKENQGSSWGLNGSILVNWNIWNKLSVGVQYRYLKNKLGVFGQSGGGQNYVDSIMFRLTYSF